MTLTLRRAVVVLAATTAALGWVVAPADATSYRFWSYWSGGSDWTFASQGASRRPTDGAVEGWRFAISEASSSSTPPRHSPGFAQLCGDTDPVDGNKRVGLVIDAGTDADAPDGESPPALVATCVVVPTDANGYDVLAAAGMQLRTDGGLICGINGYPATECGVPVADPVETDDNEPDKNSQDTTDDRGGNGGSVTTSPDAGATSTAEADEATSRSNRKPGDDRDRKEQDDDPQPGPTPSALAAAAPAAASAPTEGSGSPVGLLVGALAVVGLGAAAWALQRRRT